MNEREVALWFWERQLGEPYLWSGDDPVGGFDCSGFVCEGLRTSGMIRRKARYASWQLAERWPETTDARPGVLLFYLRGKKIGHVVVVWKVLVGGMILTIGAEGGGSHTDTKQEAIDANAFVMIRPAIQPWAKAVDPFVGSD